MLVCMVIVNPPRLCGIMNLLAVVDSDRVCILVAKGLRLYFTSIATLWL